ncbi:hypothetical protein [Leucobacter chinensis]|uniref:hypothetical protein n=1 Tax=Leucobacter chinensis TaxID=2851010 RepID=UPI001C22A7D7|nr:hypothetical protein [Leucobacter chinensis]
MPKNTRGPRYAGFRFVIPADLAAPADVAAVLDPQRTVQEYAVGLHDRDSAAPHIQGALLCPTRVALPEMHRRLSRGLDVAADLIDLDPLIAGRGRSARDAFLGFASYLPHDDAEQRARGKALYFRDSIRVSDPGIWAQVDKWRERQARKLKAARPLGEVETIELLLMYAYTDPDTVMMREPLLWRAPGNQSRFTRAYADRGAAIHGQHDLPEHLRARMPADLVERLTA